MIQLFRQRDFGEKINATFQYINRNLQSLGLALLYIAGPVALVAGVASGIIQSNFFELIGASRDSNSARNLPFQMIGAIFSPALGISVLFGLLSILAVSLVTYTHMKLYWRKMEDGVTAVVVPISVAEVWAEMQPLIGQALIVSLLSSIVTFVAAFLFFVPGLYLGIVLSLGMAVVVFEGADFGVTWNRCFTLIRDNWWATFGLIVVMGILSGMLGVLFSIPAIVINFLAGAKLLPSLGQFWVVVGSVLTTVGGSLLRSIIYIALGFQYTNLVEQQEGRGLLSAIDSIGTSPTQPRTPDDDEY